MEPRKPLQRVNILTSPEDLNRIDQFAHAHGLNRSEYIRRCALKQIEVLEEVSKTFTIPQIQNIINNADYKIYYGNRIYLADFERRKIYSHPHNAHRELIENASDVEWSSNIDLDILKFAIFPKLNLGQRLLPLEIGCLSELAEVVGLADYPPIVQVKVFQISSLGFKFGVYKQIHTQAIRGIVVEIKGKSLLTKAEKEFEEFKSSLLN